MADELDDKTLIERDRAWRDAITRGWQAEDELVRELGAALAISVRGKFNSSPFLLRDVPDAVQTTLAKALARDKGPKISSWNEEQPLVAYLTTIAVNQVHEWNKKKREKESRDDENAGVPELSVSPGAFHGESLSELGRGLLCQFADMIRELGESKPKQLIILALKALGAQQGDAAALWGMDKGQASNELKLVTNQLMQRFGGEHGFIALCELANPFPEVWCGRHPGLPSTSDALTDADRSSLFALCESPGNKAAMKEWEQRLWKDESALIWLRDCLNAVRRNEPPLEREPVLQGQGMRLKLAIERTVSRYKTRDFTAHLGDTEHLMHSAVLAKTSADAGTLWLINEKSHCLEAVFNPTEPEMIGQLQPLRSGIISWAYKNDHSIRVVRSSPEESLETGEVKHSADIDRILGKSTQAMLVVPFHCAGDQRGVLSLVKLKAGATEFTMADQDAAAALCEVLARAMERGIERRVLA